MARIKEFDPDAVLLSALELFWERGYEATSMADLVARLGIGRASLYATFGSKHDLYLKALRRYCADADPKLLAELSAPGSALEAVRGMLRRYATEAAGERRGRGCFVVNTATELPHDRASTRQVLASWTYLETLLAAALTRAQATGELSGERDPRALARMLLVLAQGVRVVGKVADDPAPVRDAVEQALSLLN